ncbi:hypothetical protein ACBJ59_10710 [Nonomuraea sp. MTCD27]|uniref:hypothetical protein n=1 Tax=Nonomuraea sp. MTCD27 TaxID=1676747 RepID=UPI0035BF053F
MVVTPGTCTMWHQNPRPMLRAALLDEGGPQRSVKPRQPVEVLCDDGRWHAAVLEAWHQGAAGLECFISWYAAPARLYMGWFGYSPAGIRQVGESG